MSIYLPPHRFFAGKVSITTALTVAVLATTTLYAYFQLASSFAFATSTVQTSVTVLNTPPQWTEDAHEYPVSATSTPTNAGSQLWFTAIGTDSSSNPYYLLVCKTSAAPTANPSAAPTCAGGASNLWAVSTTTYTSGVRAFAGTTTVEYFPFHQENNAWYAWVCDAVTNNPSCVSTFTNGESSPSDGTTYPENASPFVINHPPKFLSISNDGPANPGESVIWTAVASDTDQVRGGDTLTLLVCHARDYASGACGPAGAWATSTGVVASGVNPVNVATTTVLGSPYQDRQYNAFVYLVDQDNLAATTTYLQAGGHQGQDSSFVVNNVAPVINGSQLSFYSSTTADIILYRPNATSGAYFVDFTVTDANGCINASSTSEFTSATTTAYRSSVSGGGTCTGNTNNCYPSSDPIYYVSCAQSSAVNSCSGTGASLGNPSTITDNNIGYRCEVFLWFNADPTDAGSQYPSDTWLADAQVIDDGQSNQGSGLYSAATTSLSGTELLQFLAYNVSTTSIAYGGLQPGQNTGAFPSWRYTDLIAWGNTGLNESLYGDVMCTTWSGAESCTFASSSAIAPWNQQFATSTSLSYQESGGVSTPDEISVFGLEPSTTPRTIALAVNKTVSTTSPFSKNTYWGIGVPTSITFSGDYLGQNTIIGVVSNSAYW